MGKTLAALSFLMTLVWVSVVIAVMTYFSWCTWGTGAAPGEAVGIAIAHSRLKNL